MKFAITEIDSNDPAAMLRAAGLLTAIAAALGGTAAVPPLPAAATNLLDPADNPAAGVDPLAHVAFGGNPVEAFGGAPGANLDPEAAFGAQGNAPAANLPSTPPVGTPPAPSNGAATAGASTPGGVELDPDGLPWDTRIHAGSRAKNADGRWRKKPRLDDALLASVTAELRALMAVPGAPGGAALVPPAPPAPPAPGNVAPPSPGLPSAPPLPPLAPTTAPTAGATIPTAPAGAPSFVTIMGRVAELLLAGTLTDAEANSAVQAHGLQAYPQLVQRPDLAQAVSDTLEAVVRSKG